MKSLKAIRIFLLVSCFVVLSSFAAAQTTTLLKRTTTKTDKFDFGSGGTLALIGAPNGSVTIEGWAKNEIEILAEITIEAPAEADLDRISKLTGFTLEESTGRTGVISYGIHDKKFLKRNDKKFPKALLTTPFRIDYTIKVPRYCDLQIDGGTGDLTISGVEGTMRLNYLDTNAKLHLVGGAVTAVFGKGSADISIPTRSWGGRFVDVQLAAGTMNLSLPTGLNADFDASILRTGTIENTFTGFKPRVRNVQFTDKLIAAKAGTGGVSLKFAVGDGTMKIK